MSITTRLPADARRHFGVQHRWSNHHETWETLEPAMGTLEQRLDILVRRFGGTTGPVKMTKREREEYAAWLKAEGLTS